ncbi:dTDP-4-dehydrorhamnose 3,5-epimerase [Candidatus Micrarchaeota archaeon]|nr:MAG: dTDP-4-dehydrorhamnose 3,5-epimerase [Candidatus Micrarchaeota archaeon]
MRIGMKKLPLGDALLLTVFEHRDERGKFNKYVDSDVLRELKFEVKEVFASSNRKNVVRGLHLQKPNAQARIIWCPYGKVWDVMVDLRKGSETYLKWHAEELSDENGKGVYIPRGFAHGFLSLSEGAYVLYFADSAYDEKVETGIQYDDERIGIKWPLESRPVLSKRDEGFGKFDEKLHAYE